MKRIAPFAAALSLMTFAACAAPGGESETAAAAAPPVAALWQASVAAAGIRAASCPPADDGSASAFQDLELTVSPLDTEQKAAVSGRVPARASLAGAWALNANDPNFGGLSGLAVEDGSHLIAVTDAGGWVKLGLDNGAPTTASIAYMRGANGKFLSGKYENDAEGFAYRDGIAFVSFERNFRIEAFALGTCGAKAKAVEISALPATLDARSLDENEGPEALALTPDGHLQFGYEGASTGLSPIGRVLATNTSEWSGKRAGNPNGFALVGMDSMGLPDGSNREIFLYRAFDPLRGARSVLAWGPAETDRMTLSRPVLTDNFEGLAAQALENGNLRIWIVSDDNFSNLQRTLLYAFDVSLAPDAE